jgi:hypothetical protein
MLAEAYQRILTASSSPADVNQNVIVAFQKVDEKIRKNILGWITKELEDHSRLQVQAELDNLEKFITIAPPA